MGAAAPQHGQIPAVESGEPDRTLVKAGYSNDFKSQRRDTAPNIGALRANGLRQGTGHKKAPSFSDLLPKRHLRSIRMLGYALTLNTLTDWQSLAYVWMARLTREERQALALAALTALTPEDAEEVAGQALGAAGYPLPPLLTPLDEAQWWADAANPAERRAYCLASFMAMAPKDQRDFLTFAKGAVT